jgi:hypothetical protein
MRLKQSNELDSEGACRVIFEAVGFEYIETGGNCDAYVLSRTEKTEWFVTNGDAAIPNDMADPVILHVMPKEGGEEIKWWKFEDVLCFLEAFSNPQSPVWVWSDSHEEGRHRSVQRTSA